jgi:HlyD family secretion protein
MAWWKKTARRMENKRFRRRMNMKLRWSILVLVTALSLAACSPQATPTPLMTESAVTPAVESGVFASAIVVPAEKVELGFPAVGMIQTVEVQVGDTVTAGQTIATLDTTISEARVREAEAGVVMAETEVRYLRRVGTTQERLDAAQADVDRAQAAVDQAKATLAQSTLITPIGGTVVSLEIAPGETVAPGQIVIVIGNLDDMQVETTDLSELDVPAIQIGQKANVFIEALNENFDSEVIDISRQATTSGGDVVYKVTLKLDKQPDGLRWGMSAEVNIDTEQ